MLTGRSCRTGCSPRTMRRDIRPGCKGNSKSSILTNRPLPSRHRHHLPTSSVCALLNLRRVLGLFAEDKRQALVGLSPRTWVLMCNRRSSGLARPRAYVVANENANTGSARHGVCEPCREQGRPAQRAKLLRDTGTMKPHPFRRNAHGYGPGPATRRWPITP
jgi:hypothetical protein